MVALYEESIETAKKIVVNICYHYYTYDKRNSKFS
jgi:hypothetical protein